MSVHTQAILELNCFQFFLLQNEKCNWLLIDKIIDNIPSCIFFLGGGGTYGTYVYCYVAFIFLNKI